MIKKRLPKKQSLGIACCRYNTKTNKPEILLVEKRCSYNFQAFVFGHYNNDNLKILFDEMTNHEKLDILSGEYEILWFKIFLRFPKLDKEKFYIEGTNKVDPIQLKKYHKMYKNKFHVRKEKTKIKKWKKEYTKKTNKCDLPEYVDYDSAALHFCSLKYKYDKLFENGGKQKLIELVHQSKSLPLVWEIPKGRISKGESFIECAMREFKEETFISPDGYKIINNKPIAINHISSENICYVYKYFIAIYDNDYKYKNKYDVSKYTETINSKWVTLTNCELIDNGQNRLYRLCKKILRIFKKKCKNGYDFTSISNITNKN